MDEIKQWTIMISCVSVISGILLSLVPGGRIKPAYKTLVSILLVYTFMLPVINSFSVDFDIEDYLKDNYRISEKLDEYAVDNTLSSAETAIEKTLNEYFSVKKIKCIFDAECIIDDDEIKLNKITVICNEKQDEILSFLRDSGFEEDIIEFKGDLNEQ